MSATIKQSAEKEATTNFRHRGDNVVKITRKTDTKEQKETKVDPEKVFGYEDREQDENAYSKPARDVRDGTRDEVNRQIEEHTKEKCEYYSANLPYSDAGESLVGVPRIAFGCEAGTDGRDPECGRQGKIDVVAYQYRG